jgi:hypothetical protein
MASGFLYFQTAVQKSSTILTELIQLSLHLTFRVMRRGNGRCSELFGYLMASSPKASQRISAVDTLGHLLVLTVTPADQGDREQVATLAEEEQQVTGNNVELA